MNELENELLQVMIEGEMAENDLTVNHDRQERKDSEKDTNAK